MYMDNSILEKCKICGKCISDFEKLKKNDYKINTFKNHLKNHSICIEEYICKYFDTKRPICKCGICNKECKITSIGAKFKWSEYVCGRFDGWQENAKKLSNDRKGVNNPMYNKEPWNKNLNKEKSDSLLLVSKKLKNRIISEHTKNKMSESAKKRTVHGHTGKKHSEETKNKLKILTINLIKSGIIKNTETKPHVKMRDILSSFNIKFEEEKRVGYYLFDFYLLDFDIYIEVDGDYWHSNPIKYKNGPISLAQKINFQRDINKNEFCKKNNFTLIRFWENDIINNENEVIYKICNLKK